MGYRLWDWVGSQFGFNKIKIKEIMHVRTLMEEARRKMKHER
jgi:hypothetical protein